MTEPLAIELKSRLTAQSTICIALFGNGRPFKDLNALVADHIDSLVVETIKKTPLILPHKRITNPNSDIKWNTLSFTQGLAANRGATADQPNHKHTVRHGMALSMENGFVGTSEGMDTFRMRMKQLVESIRTALELEALTALVDTPCIERRSLFGIFKKNPANAVDILISEARRSMRCPPAFLLCHSKLARAGEFHGIKIVNSDSDLFRRKTSVAEYYRVPPQPDRHWELELYDESRGTWFRLTPDELDFAAGDTPGGGPAEYVIIRPAIEHFMLSVIVGGEGVGNTFWGQTDAECYEDTERGLCGLSYKYSSKAIVLNSSNMAHFADVAYDGYIGGKDDRLVDSSLVVMKFYAPGMSKVYWPSPIVFHDTLEETSDPARVFNRPEYSVQYKAYLNRLESFGSTQAHQAYQGSMRLYRKGESVVEIRGSGHHDFCV